MQVCPLASGCWLIHTSFGMASLATIGRKHYVSEHALASILKEVREIGDDMPEAISRSSLKRARHEWANTKTTDYGPILHDLDVIDGVPN